MSDAYVTPAGPLRAVVEGLERGGVRDVVICPGSRSTPLALALRAAPGLRPWVHLDERAGAFFALGAAKASRRPAAILATSGTAVVNFAPAVTEARYGRVPLILLTADRPPELQGRGSPQTIDQADLYGRHAKWFAELPVPEASAGSEAHARELVRRVLEAALSAPAGPVQLNLPFREALLPDGSLVGASRGAVEPPRSVVGIDPADLDLAAGEVAAARRGLIVCGPIDQPGLAEAVTRLAAASGFPLLADGLSGVRTGPHDRSRVIAHHDALLRSWEFRDGHAPDLALRFGAAPTSRSLNELLDALTIPQLLVDDSRGWERPKEPTLVEADAVAFADALTEALAHGGARAGDGWLDSWRAADAAAGAALRSWREARDEPFEGALFEALETAVPEGCLVVAGNSMPVRDLDSFLPGSAASVRLLGNRGANGIDGLISTALGAAAAQTEPVLAVVGDVSFLHDLNALVAARRLGISATILLVNNDGGGIFSFLPQASADLPESGLPEHFEELFGTPHGTEFGPLVRALGGEHVVADHQTLLPLVRAALDAGGLGVVELRTDRVRNVELHREAFAAVARAVETST